MCVKHEQVFPVNESSAATEVTANARACVHPRPTHPCLTGSRHQRPSQVHFRKRVHAQTHLHSKKSRSTTGTVSATRPPPSGSCGSCRAHVRDPRRTHTAHTSELTHPNCGRYSGTRTYNHLFYFTFTLRRNITVRHTSRKGTEEPESICA